MYFSVLSAFAKLRKATIAFVMYVRLSVGPSAHVSVWNSSAAVGQIFTKFGIWVFFTNLSIKLRSIKIDKSRGQCT